MDLALLRPTVRCPLEVPEAAREINAWAAPGPIPTEEGRAKILSLLMLESGSFESCYNHNAANVRLPSLNPPAHPWFRHPGKVSEVVDGRVIYATSPDDPLRIFRSFDSLVGNVEWVFSWIQRNHSKALSALLSDSVAVWNFAKVFASPNDKGRRYCTADADSYADGVASRYGVAYSAIAGATLLPALRVGSSGPEVSKWQQIVGAPVTGKFDSSTLRAVKAWQERNPSAGNPDGVIGAMCRIAVGLPFTLEGR